ncbi:TolC family protein [Parasediminibacterium sp. JCM 36343]|uniref:TolC family protein n=1 Tax=Parasediminibacterium sp. JCM 36343 TaxID=3374279 RepID=UPI00397CA563
MYKAAKFIVTQSKHQLKPFFFSGFFFLFCTHLFAQQGKDTITITNLAHLWQVAIQNNSTHEAYNLKKDLLTYNYKAANNYLYPQAGIGFNGQDNLKLAVTPVPGEIFRDPGKTYYLQFGKHYTYNTGLTVTKGIFNWQERLQAKIAQENINLNSLQQDAFVQNLKTQATQNYYSLMVAKASLSIAQKDLLLADSISDITLQKFKEGLIDSLAVNQSLINANNVKQNTYQSQQLYKQSLANIKTLSGLAVNTYFIFGEVLNMDAETLIENSVLAINIGTDKTLLPYLSSLAISKLQSKAQKAATYPNLSLTGYFGYQQFQDNFGLQFSNGAWSGYQYIGLNFNWPLFTGFANSNKLKSSLVQQLISEEDSKAAIQQSNINDSLLVSNYESYRSMAANAKNTFRLYGKNLDLSLQKYREGLISLDGYLKTFQDYLNAENSYLSYLSSMLYVKAAIISRNE